jgi:hypothetical protein
MRFGAPTQRPEWRGGASRPKRKQPFWRESEKSQGFGDGGPKLNMPPSLFVAPMKGARRILLLSAAVAVAACAAPFIFASDEQFGFAVYASLLLAVIWTILFLVGVIRYRANGLWILCGLPFAALWPVWYVCLAIGEGMRK